jgi:hypothetical protein
MEWAISELDTLSSKLATGQNPTFLTASSLTVLAADFLSGLGQKGRGHNEFAGNGVAVS